MASVEVVTMMVGTGKLKAEKTEFADDQIDMVCGKERSVKVGNEIRR